MEWYKIVDKSLNIQPSQFVDYRQYLQGVYMGLKKEGIKISYASLGDYLGLSKSNAINHIIKGRRPLSKKAAESVAKALHLTGKQKRYFIAMVEYHNEKKASKKSELFYELYELKEKITSGTGQEHLLKYFSTWEIPVIGELAKCGDLKENVSEINKRLHFSIREKDIKDHIDFLCKNNILNRTEDGYLRRSSLDFSPGYATKNLLVASYHHQMIDLASQALSYFSEDKRDYSTMTIAISRKQVEKLKELIQGFQRKVMELEDTQDQPEQLYQVNVQMFPFSK